MAVPTGGLRDRMIHESILQNLKAQLTTLGWFGVTRQHSAIVMIDEFPDENSEVQPNTLAVSLGDGGGVPRELGNKDESHELTLFVDFFAEDDSVGREMRGDVYAYFRGNQTQPVYDYRDAIPSQFGTVDVLDDIEKRKPERAINKWQKHWYVVSITVVDERDYT
jgi:hypothetical protein